MISSKNLSKKVKIQVLEEYYRNSYKKLFYGKSILSSGIGYSHQQLEKVFNGIPNSVLEIGGSNGEHLLYVKFIPSKEYISLDLVSPKSNINKEIISVELQNKLKFVKGNAEELKYKNSSFDCIIVTCVLAHVDDVMAVLFEIKRVAKKGAQIGILLPTDPGILNRLIKYLFTYPKLKKFTTISPKFINALEHKNHVSAIMEQISYVFSSDDLKFNYKPFSFFKSWNFNLLIIAKIIIT
jgi:ubiquinone/menaquinone biosynthesis C-methylase UbiE